MNSKEFAKLLGVSQSTVSRALNGSSEISEKTTRFIVEKANEYGFVLNSQAKSLKSSRTGTIGILFPKFWESLSKNLMFTYIYDCILKDLTAIDYDVMVVYDTKDSPGINTLERVVKSRKVDGFINLRPSLTQKELHLIERYSTPCVSIFQPLQSDYPLCQFCMDEYHAGVLAGRYFGSQPDYHLTYLSLPLEVDTSAHRFEGFCSGLAEYGRKPDKVIQCELSTQDAYQSVIREESWFRHNRTSVFVYNDMLALGVVQALQKLSVSIPQDVQIIGLDDIPMCTWFPPALSTLHTPVHDLVHAGCTTLKKLLDNESVEVCSSLYLPRLIHRDTTLG